MWQYGQYPGNRFPNWDYSWADAINISRVSELQKELQNFQIPEMNFFTGLGLEKLSEVAGYLNPINPLHLLLFFDISPLQFILIKTCLFLSLLQIGTFHLLHSLTNNKTLSILTALLSASLPAYWSIIYPFSTLYCFVCSIPFFIYFYLKYMENHQMKYLTAYFALTLCIGPDLLTTGNIIVLNLALLWMTKKSNNIQLKSFIYFSLTGAIGTMTFWYPYLFLLQNRKNRLIELGIMPEAEFNFFQYWKFFASNGGHTLIYPVEGSAILAYTPVFCLLTVTMYFFYRKKRTINEKYITVLKLMLVIFTIFIGPSLLYIHPITSKFLFSYYRNNFNMLPILLLIITAVIFSELKKSTILKILFCSVGIELVLFIINPLARMRDILPKGELIAQTIAPKNYIYDSNLLDTLNVKIPFITNQPWLNLTIANFAVALMLAYSANERVLLKRTELFYALCAVIVFCAYSTNIELRRYMGEWQQVSVSDSRFNNYNKRTIEWVNKYQINEPNFRVLLTGKEIYKNSGRNIKLSLDSELNNNYSIKMIPSYRELDNVDMGLTLFKLACPNCSYNKGESLTQNWPPTVEQMLANQKWVSENSIKYVITADEMINSIDFVLLDEFQYPKSNYGYDESENGLVYLYKFRDPTPIISSYSGVQNLSEIKISSGGITFFSNSPLATPIAINYLYSNGFKATFNDRPLRIMKTPENKMTLSLPGGRGKFEMTYHDSKLTQSVSLQLAIFLLLSLLHTRRKISIRFINFISSLRKYTQNILNSKNKQNENN